MLKTKLFVLVELEDLPFTTPDYIFNLQNWKPRLFSVHRKGPGIKDDDTSWNDYSYEPLESVNPSTTTGLFLPMLN